MLLDGMRSNAARSWGVKLAVGLIIVVFVFLGLGSVQAPTGVVATVNDSQITFREFQRSYSRIEQEIKSMMPNITAEQLAELQIEGSVLEQLIVSKLLAEESDRTGIDVSALEFRNAITSLPYFQNDKGEFDKKLYGEMIAQNGQSIAEFEALLGQDLLPEHFTKILSSGVFISDATVQEQYAFIMEKRSIEYVNFPYNADAQIVTDKEIEDAYNVRKAMYAMPARIQLEYINFDPDNMADPESITEVELQDAYSARETQYVVSEQVKARHLLIQIPQNASDAEVSAVLKNIKSIETRIRAGANFEELAKQYSTDATKDAGGDLGWFAKNQMVPAFADAAFALGIGEISAPVRTSFGYHLILVEDRKEAKISSFEEVQGELREVLALEKANMSLRDIVDASLIELANNKSFAELASIYPVKVEQTKLLDANALAESLGLRPADVEILMSVEKGTLWDSPIAIGAGLAIVRVIDSQPEMAQPLAEVENIIKKEIAIEKSQTAAFEDAKKAVETFSNTIPQNIKTSAFFARTGEIEELGINILLAKDIFASDDKNWKKTPFIVENGVAVVRLAEIKNVSLADFDADKQILINEMTSANSEMMFRRYVAMLRAKADIAILMPQLFDQGAPR